VQAMTDDEPCPPFRLWDAEQIVRRLAPALREHGEWIQRIHTILVCRSDPDPDDIKPGGHLRAGLGQWFEQEANAFIRSQPAYDEATRRHREVHALARALCQSVHEDAAIERATYEEFAAAVNALDNNLEALVKEIWDLLRFTDPLTGIATRYAMLPRLKQERDRADRTGDTCSICMVDLDRFKNINDSYGHDAGDKVLEAVSDYFVGNLRRYDQPWRYGGEEFVLMLPNTSPQSAFPVIDRLRRGLAELPIDIGEDRDIRITASFGLAALESDRPVADSIGKADAAMYEAKRAGRNLVRLWTENSDARAKPGLAEAALDDEQDTESG